jgi:hypothetical protein
MITARTARVRMLTTNRRTRILRTAQRTARRTLLPTVQTAIRKTANINCSSFSRRDAYGIPFAV